MFAELCVPGNKQVWHIYVNGIDGMNRLRNVGADACLERFRESGTLTTPGVRTCARYGYSDNSQDFIWFPA